MPDLRLDRLSAEAANAVLLDLREARERLDRILSRRSGLTEYARLVILQRRSAVEREIDQLQRNLTSRMVLVIDAGVVGANLDAADAVGGIRFGVDAGVLAFARDTAGEAIRNVTDDVRRAVRRAVTRSLAGGLSMSELDLEIVRSFDGPVTAGRVERIARTELGRAYGQQGAAINEELVARGIDLIQRWVAFRDHRTRETHEAVDGQERELDEPFHVGPGASAATAPGDGVGFPCNAPQDPALPPEESIQCRCRRVLVPREEARQPYIAKVRRAVPVDVGGGFGGGPKPPEAPARA